LVYCLTKEWAEHINNQINEDEGDTIAELYHGRMSPEVREGIYRDWKKGKFKVLAATSALGMGVDYAHVRNVFHRGQSHSLMDFSQESGRAGRDGAEPIVVTSNRFRRDCEWMKEKGRSEWRSMEDWVERKACRKWMLEYMDGCGKGMSCLDGGDSGLCDTCNEHMTEAGGMTTQWQFSAVGDHVRGNVSMARENGR
jgi:superfamily II DNA helicase RecQ